MVAPPVPGVIAYGTSLPTAPTDGQEAVLVDSVTNPSYQWRFRYNAGSSSTYKWEFVGGVPYIVFPAQFQPSTTGQYLADTAPGSTLTIPRAGVYILETEAGIGAPGTNSGQYLGFDATNRVGQYVATGTEGSIFYRHVPTLTAGQALTNIFYCTTATSMYNRRQIAATPVRVS